MILFFLILSAGEPVYERDVLPFVKQHCIDCHSGPKAKGDFRLILPTSSADALKSPAQWERVAQVLRSGDMPPSSKPRPSKSTSDAVNQWIDEKALGVVCAGTPKPGRVTLRRLNREEYGNAMRDLLGIGYRVGEDLPADDVGDGFDNQADVLTLSPLHLEKYLANAEQAVSQAWRSPSGKRALGIRNNGPESTEQLKAFIVQQTRRAWRRPASAADVDRLTTMSLNAGSKPEERVTAAMTAILVSPRFLFLVEGEPPPGAADRALDGYERAARLALFLWSSVPDDTLLDAAANGELMRPEGLNSQVERMLRDGKSKALARNFTGQWLQLRNLKTIQPDPVRFPGITEALKEDMLGECEAFFANMLTENGPITDFIDSRYTFVNDRLAQFYGYKLPKVRNAGFRRYDFTDDRRGGITTMAGVLLVTSNPTRTSPVKRGKFVLENILGTPPPPPPPGVEELKDTPAARQASTLRQRMEEHRRNPNCAVCHTKMDALGFGLENFDVVGRWRTEDEGKKIDVAGVLPDGKAFAKPSELRALLGTNPEMFADCLARKMLTYALGRSLGAKDRCVVDQLVSEMKCSGWGLTVLVKAVARSESFTHREKAPTASNGVRP